MSHWNTSSEEMTCWRRPRLRTKSCLVWTDGLRKRKPGETRGGRAKQVLCGDTQCLLSAFQQCQDPGALSVGPYLSQLNYWCVSSDLWAARGGVPKKRLGPGWRWPGTTWSGHGGWLSDCVCAWTGVIRGYPKLVVVVCIGGRGRVKLWAAGAFGHIVCFRVQAAEGRLLFHGRLPSSTLPVSPVDFHLTAALGTEWTKHTHAHTQSHSRQDGLMVGYMLSYW